MMGANHIIAVQRLREQIITRISGMNVVVPTSAAVSGVVRRHSSSGVVFKKHHPGRGYLLVPVNKGVPKTCFSQYLSRSSSSYTERLLQRRDPGGLVQETDS